MRETWTWSRLTRGKHEGWSTGGKLGSIEFDGAVHRWARTVAGKVVRGAAKTLTEAKLAVEAV